MGQFCVSMPVRSFVRAGAGTSMAAGAAEKIIGRFMIAQPPWRPPLSRAAEPVHSVEASAGDDDRLTGPPSFTTAVVLAAA
ncbi:hypothetical protein D3105_29345 [Streptomyces globisporus]|uniref:Uncharacterized protein n=1 Tax=Streptomyces globisporus TaxID=1908 RepID=A0A423URX1_STRGL|nr:hypothetical protein D3105_29345 [Streptomyces globisporus]